MSSFPINMDDENMSDVLLKVESLKKYFPVEKKSFLSFRNEKNVIHAVDDVSFSVNSGETFSLVGETGCGKTTIGKMTLRLIEPTEGKVFFDGYDLFSLNKKEIKKFRRNAQIIHQDPLSSLNPRKTVEDIIGLPLEAQGIAGGKKKRERVLELLEKVGLSPARRFIDRFPHEFSGGQRQRIAIARAISVNPKYIVADEPVSSLDMSIRAQILNLLQEIKEIYKITYLFISHDLSVVRFISDHVLVIYSGKAVEFIPGKELFKSPLHPYTKALILASLPVDTTVKIERLKVHGEMPSQINPPSGCRFHTRCPFAEHKCKKVEPEFVKLGHEHYVACHLWS